MNYFGTDGIRGTFGSTLTQRTAFLLGKSLALSGDCPIIVVARDTRTSGQMLFTALAQGVYQGGGNVINLGVLPTNAVGHFVRKLGGDFGVMITASHNPPRDNGLKVFDKYGVKLCASKQLALSRIMESLLCNEQVFECVCEPVFYDIENIYVQDIVRDQPYDLSKLNVALDCCFGATYRIAPMVFERLGANVQAFNASANGEKINVNCGATCPQHLQSKLDKNSQLAFAFDGDGDRLAVFERGVFVPNNKVFFAMAKYLHQQGKLAKSTVCGTTLTNGGVKDALQKLGVQFVASDVGDVNVFNAMVTNGLNFGGEQSGHYLLCDYATSADAVINALFVCKIFQETGSLLQYSASCVDVPSVTVNIDLTDQDGALVSGDNLDKTARKVASVYPNCKVVLRMSGTESKLRCYFEGEDAQKAKDLAVATFAQRDI